MLFQDPEKTPAPVGFQPFSSSHTDEERDEREERGVSFRTVKHLTLIPPLFIVLKMLPAFNTCCIYSSALQTRFFH